MDYFFCGMFAWRIEIRLQLYSAFVHHFDIFLLSHNYVIYLFDGITFFDDVRITLYFDMSELRMEATFSVCSSLWRIFVTLQLRCLFVRLVTFFDNDRITLYFGTFELRMEITSNYVSFLLVIATCFLLRHN